MPARNLFVLLIVAMVASVALAIPNEIQYQGKLTDTDGIGMNGDFEMSFRIFDAPTAGTLLWTELHHAPADEVTVTKGLFDVLLGSLTPIALDFSVDYWLEITVDGNILLPRVKLSSSPYAYRAAIADSVVGGSAVGDTALWQVHVTDPLIFPKNNTNVLFYDDGEDMTIYAENALATGTGTSVIYGYANGSSSDPTTWELNDMNSALKGYVDFGENFSAGVAGFYDGWGTPSAAVLGSYITGTDEIGALGYYDGSYFIGVYGQQGEFGDYAGWFNGNFHLEPQPEPLTPLHGDIYADDATNKAYFFNGTDWVDMTATPGAGSSQWTDHAVDPYIFANNNANIQAYDATEDTFFMVNAFGSSAGTAIRGLGDYGPADSCLGYLGYGGELIGHPESWYGAGVYGYSEASVDAVYGFAADGGNGVFGVTQGLNDEFWRFAGVRGYNADSLTDGRLGTWHYGGEFVKGIWLEPGTAPWESEGAIYANSSDNNLYYYDGTSWVDLTAVGAGVGGGGTVDYIPLWTPDGSTLGDSRIQQNATTTFINSDPVMQANFSVYNDETTDLHAIVGSNLNGSVVDGSSWDFYGSGGTGVMGINETPGQYKAGLHGIVWSDYSANIAGVVGSNELNDTYGALSYYNGTNWFAGWFNGLTNVAGSYQDPIAGWVGLGEGILNVTNDNLTGRTYGIQSRIPYAANNFSGAIVGSIYDPATTNGVMGALGFRNHLGEPVAMWAHDDLSGLTSHAIWAKSSNVDGYAGWFEGNFHLVPQATSIALEGNLHANSSDNKLYYHDGTSWVDLTAGGGTGQWEDAGDYKRVIGNDAVRAYESGFDYGLWAYAGSATYWGALGYKDSAGVYGSGYDCYGMLGSDKSLSADMFGYGTWGDAGVYGDGEDWTVGVFGRSDWAWGVVGVTNNSGADYSGVLGQNTTNETQGALGKENYGVWGDQGTGTHAGYFAGDVRVTGLLYDSSGDAGTAGQVLSATGTGTNWVTGSGGADADWTIGTGKIYNNTDSVVIGGTNVGSIWALLTVEGGDIVLEGNNNFIDIDDAGTSGSGFRFYRSGVFDGGLFNSPGSAWISGGYTNRTLNVDLVNERVGIGTGTPTVKFDVEGNARVNGDLEVTGIIDPVGVVYEPQAIAPSAVEGMLYYNDTANELRVYDGASWQSLGGGGGIGGGGTANYIPLWTPDGSTLGDSKIRDEGTYTLIHSIGSTPVKPGNFSAAADNSSDYFGIWASNSGGTTTAGTAWTHDGVGGGGLLSNNSSSSPKYFAAIMGFNWSDAETTAAVVGADDNSSNFGALAYRANSKTWAGYFSGDILINSDEDTTNNDYLYFGNDNHYLVWVPGGDRFVFTNSVVPNLGNSFDLGHTSWRWRDIYGHKVVTDSITLGGVTRGTWPTGGADDDWQITGDGIAPDTVYNDEDIICMGSASPTPLLPGWWQMVDIDATGYPIGLYVSGANSYPIAARWSGSSAGAAISAINTGTGGDAIQASADGTGRSAIAAWGSAGVTTAIYADADGADKAGLFLGDVDVIGDADGLYAENIQDAPHSAIYGYATQIATSSDYVNIGVRGYGKGFNSGWGVGVGVMGMANADSSYDVAGVYGYLTADGTYPEYISGYEDAAIHGNGNDLGYSGWFANGPFHLPTLAFAPTGLRGDIYSNTTDNNLYYYDGTSWVDLTAGGGGGVGGSGTANYIPLWTPDGSTLGDSRIEQNTNSVYINANPGMTSAFAVYCNTSGSGTEYNGIFGDNKYGNSTTGTDWDFGECGAGVFGLNEIDTEYRAGVVGVAWGVYGDHTAGVVGANSDGSVYGGLGYRIDDIDYAGYFAGDVNITGDLTVDGTLDVDGYLKLDAVNNTSGQTTWNSTYAGGNALRLNANTSTASVYIQNASTGWGLSAGVNDATSTGYGVYGFQYGTGYGVYGKNYNASGTGVRGINDNTGTYGDLAAPFYGVYGYSAPDQYGYIASTSYGLYGHDDSDNYGYLANSNYGVYGRHVDGNYGYLGGSAFGVYGYLFSDDPGDYAIYGYGVSTSADSGTGYTRTASMGGVKGYNFYGNPYTFGVAGYSYLDHNRSGGTFGSNNTGSVWGSMGYQNSTGTEYGGYFTSYTSGAGRARPMPDEAVSGIGFGSYGDFLGGWVRGDVGGLMIKGGELFASYTDGIAVTNDVSVTLTETSGDERAVSYSVQSMSVDVYARGIGRLEEGSRRVDFADDFASMISDEEIPVVTVTPLGCCNGVYISEIDKDGFTVVENSGGRSDIQFTWIAIGTRYGYENGVDIHSDVRSADFDRKIDGAMFNDADTQNNASPLWWDGSNLKDTPIPDMSKEEREQMKLSDPAYLEQQEMEAQEAELRRQETERQRQIELRRKQEIEIEKKQSTTMRDGAVVTPAEVAE